MASRNKITDQNRREAQYWAEEWRIRQKRNRILTALAVAVGVVLLGFIIHYVSIFGSRTIFSSEEEMRSAVQGRFESDWGYEDIFIEGENLTLTYYDRSHYDRDYAEKYGYSEYGDSVYEDKIEKWDYRRGVIKLKWMDDITVDKKGRLVYYHQEYTHTDKPMPDPIDPSTLSNYQDDEADSETPAEPELSEEEQAELDIKEESQQETEEAAEDAGILPEGESDAV